VRPLRLSFRHKLWLLVGLAAAGPVLLATGVLLWYEREALRQQAMDDASSVARLMGANTAAALAFGDAVAARENLAALATKPEVEAAAVYGLNGRLFAAYRRSGAAPGQVPDRVAPDGRRFEGDHLVLAEGVHRQADRLGTVMLWADTGHTHARLQAHGAKVLLVLVLSAAAVLLLTARLQRTLTRPLLRLAHAALQVSQLQDYSVRVDVEAGDELGALTMAFNEMLSEIQERDAALQSARDVLEQRVRDRVQDLQREVTERRDVEQALRESQTKLREILENTTNLFYAHGPDHVLTFVSAQARAFFDCESEEAMVHWAEFVTDNPANREGSLRTQRALSTGQRQPAYERELRGLLGRTVWVEVNEAPVVRDGRTVAIVGALTDITARKRAEEERQRLESQFRQAQKMEAVGRLAGGIAHDFNNLLAVILGYAELLRRDMRPGERGERRVDEIQKAAERAAALTRQLLAFSRKQVLDPKVLSLETVVSDLQSMLRRLIREDVRLNVSAAEGLWRIRADRSQVEQVLLNLSVNARDAMPEGGTLTIGVTNAQLDVGGPAHLALPPGRYVKLTVADTGCGMDAETLSHVFEPFFTTKEKGAGTGLGLATVYGIVQQSGGAVDVASAPQTGSTFTVYLPAVDSPLEEARAVPAPPPAGRGTLLVVEDEPSLRRLTCEILESQGYTVIDAASAAQALALVAEHQGPLDLMITDVIMPGLSGRQLAERVTERRPGMPVLYMSGYTADVIAHHGVLDPDIMLLEKPFTPDALLERVQDALRSSGAAAVA
jgi:two-component system, cell cycle sensor histidine kinase and response regulator CckA